MNDTSVDDCLIVRCLCDADLQYTQGFATLRKNWTLADIISHINNHHLVVPLDGV